MDDKLHRERPPDPAEGVRILGAEEADQAAERDDVARRLPDDAPRYGDRPAAPAPEGPRPALRFPMSGLDDPQDLNRPRAAANPPAPPDEPDEPTRPAPPPSEGEGDVSLPHWTEPGTGEVPRIFGAGAGDEPEPEADDDLAAWSSFTSSQPRWRGESTDAEAEEVDDFSRFADEGTRLGALDPSRPDPGYYTFEDLEDDPRRSPGAPGGPGAPGAPGDMSGEPEPVFSAPTARPITSDPRRSTTRAGAGAAYDQQPPAGPRDLQTALIVGVGFAAVALFLFWLGPLYTMFLVTGVILLAAAEFFNALRRAGHQPATLLGIASCAGMVLAVYWKGPAAIPIVLFLAVVFSLLWYWFGAAGGERPVTGVSLTLFGVCYIGVLGSFAALLLQQPHGIGLLLGAVVPAVGYDVGGLLVGRSFGRSPLTAISPNKTWEGLAGGIILAVLATVVILGFPIGVHPWGSFWPAFRVGVAVGLIAAPLGDLCESLLKRDLGVKDMGELLPGHGGLLDRFDALLFALPTTYYVANLIF
ncbi:MAG: phosphatidate cytidylyltransferase [Acidimicrobiales bacterium]